MTDPSRVLRVALALQDSSHSVRDVWLLGGGQIHLMDAPTDLGPSEKVGEWRPVQTYTEQTPTMEYRILSLTHEGVEVRWTEDRPIKDAG
jgi:hypothetical protein